MKSGQGVVDHLDQYFLYGLIGPFAAALYQRFWLRRTMPAAMALLSAGYGLSTRATHYWQFVVLWGAVVAADSGMAATVLSAAVPATAGA